MKKFLLVVFFILFSSVAHAHPVEGVWTAEDGSRIKVFVCGKTKICSRVLWTNYLNSNDSKIRARAKRTIGLDIFSDMHYYGYYWKGVIYNPKNGKSYSVVITISPKATVLKLEGCVLFGTICGKEHWFRK